MSFGIIDYWNDGDGKPYFYYKNDDTAHSFEGFVSYDFGPVGASWQTYFAGSDYQADGKRAYSSYFELAAPFRLASCDWDSRFGQLVANPASQHFYYVFGLTLKAI